MELKSIEIKTPKGILKATINPDPNYPGIFIDLIDEEGLEDAVALIEHEPDKGIRTLAYTKESEDYKSETIW